MDYITSSIHIVIQIIKINCNYRTVISMFRMAESDDRITVDGIGLNQTTLR